MGLQREHPGASIQGLARQTAEPGDVSVAMETLPRASGRTSPPRHSFPLCGLCNALPRQWGLLGGLARGGDSRQKPTSHPSNQQLTTGCPEPSEGRGCRPGFEGGRDSLHASSAGSVSGNSLLASSVLCWGGFLLPHNHLGGGLRNKAKSGPSQSRLAGLGRSCGLAKSPGQLRWAVHPENHPLGENEVYRAPFP